MQPQMNHDPSMQRHQAVMNNAAQGYKPPNQYMTSAAPSSMPYQTSMYPTSTMPAGTAGGLTSSQQPVYYIPPSNMPYGAPQLQSVAPYGAYVIPYMPLFQPNQPPQQPTLQQTTGMYYPQQQMAQQQPIQQMPQPQLQPQPPAQPNMNPIRSNIMRRAPSLQPSLAQAPPPKQPVRIINEAPALLQPSMHQPARRPTLIDDPLRLPRDPPQDTKPSEPGPDPLTHQPLILYRYQKPVSISDLRYPTDKYRDLIYKPRVSRVIDPLVYNTSLDDWLEQPLHNNQAPPPPVVENLPPLLATTRSLSNPVPTTRAHLFDDLKLPTQRVTNDRRPTLVNDLQLPKDKVRFFTIISHI